MVPTDEARITIHIFCFEIWSDDVIGTVALDIVALLEGKTGRPDLFPVVLI
jgi:hypothetical protein